MTATLGQRIRELREGRDLSLRDLARKLGGFSAAHLSDIELGRRFPSDELLANIADKLDTTVADLRQYDSRPPLDEIKKMAEANPAYGFALRKMVEKHITPEDIERLIEDKSKGDKK
jgi:transcriptional regulator with XRE-family HTH domain